MRDDLTPSMCQTLTTLAVATRPTGAARWAILDGLNVNKGSIYALERRGFVVWNAYRGRAKVTPSGWDLFEDIA